MTPRLPVFARRGFVAASVIAFGIFGYGCGGSDPSFSAQFTASTTPPAPRLIKLVQQSASGKRVLVQAVIYGPDVTLDMYTFAFDVKIGDTSVLKLVPNSAVAGNALTASGGQTITAIAGLGTLPGGGVDNSTVVVGVGKLGGGAGNGVAGASSIIVSLAFDVIKQGTSTLAIAAAPVPSVLDQNGVAIGAITFDSAAGSVTSISTGGGY